MMRPVLNQLIQLQELCFALSEKELSTSKVHLAELEESIDKMRAKLPPDVASLFDRLRSRNSLVVVPAVNAACSACRQALPTSLDFDVRSDDELPVHDLDDRSIESTAPDVIDEKRALVIAMTPSIGEAGGDRFLDQFSVHESSFTRRRKRRGPFPLTENCGNGDNR